MFKYQICLTIPGTTSKAKLEKFDPDMVGVTSTTPTFNQAVRIADAVKEFNKKIVTAIGGAHVSANPDSSNTRRSFDKVVIGEGEKAVVDIASTIEKGNDFAGGHRVLSVDIYPRFG